jgi:hypothetical protein
VNGAFSVPVLQGSPLDGELVVDCHTHLGPWHNFHIPDNDAAGLLRSMDRLGINLAVCSPHRAIAHDYLGGNDEAVQLSREHPNRFRPYITINPNYPEAEIAAEIERRQADGSLFAFKLHPSEMRYHADGPALRAVWEAANEAGIPILSHSWANDEYASPRRLGELADRYRSAKVIIAHAASSWEMIGQASEVAAARDNVFLDLTGSAMLPGAVEAMADAVGPGRILFGTDIPFLDPRPGLGRLALARISDDAKRLIFGLNAQRVFRL